MSLKAASLALALIAIAGATVSLPRGGDAGTGGDAGDTPLSATAVPYGTFAGAHDSPKDADWYALPERDSPSCLEVTASSTAWLDLTVAVDGFAETATIPESGRLRWGFVDNRLDDVLVGLTPTVNPSGGTASRPGSYVVEAGAFGPGDLGSGDGGTGGDAAAKAPSATPLTRPCFAGSLAVPSGDTADVYSFAGVAGHTVTISFQRLVDADAFLTLATSSGTELAEISDGHATTTLPSTGTYYLAVTQAGDTSTVFTAALALPLAGMTSVPYLAAVTDDPGQGCRPMCVE